MHFLMGWDNATGALKLYYFLGNLLAVRQTKMLLKNISYLVLQLYCVTLTGNYVAKTVKWQKKKTKKKTTTKKKNTCLGTPPKSHCQVYI